MITTRETLLFAAVLWPSLRLPIALVDRGLELLGAFEAKVDLSTRLEAFRDALEREVPELGAITRGQALDALESPGPTSAASVFDPDLDLLAAGDRARLVAGVELARRTATKEAA